MLAAEEQQQKHPSDDSTIPKYRIRSLYKFVPLIELESLQEELDQVFRANGARGNILLAPEGINGTLCYPLTDEDDDSDSDVFWDYLSNHAQLGAVATTAVDGEVRLRPMQTTVTWSNRQVFYRLKIKRKSEIVTLGLPVDAPVVVDPTRLVGQHVAPGPEWDRLIMDPDVLVIDTRNKYEVELGTFEHAVHPNTDHFRQFPDWLHTTFSSPPSETKKKTPKAVAMFCTGGIRCEKATSHVLASGLLPPQVPVYHLEGGILSYLLQKEQDKTPSKFKGECYVFDQRVAVGTTEDGRVTETERYTACFACRRPQSPDDRTHPDYKEGLSCRTCKDARSDRQKLRSEERQRQIQLLDGDQQHFHDPKEIVFEGKLKAEEEAVIVGCNVLVRLDLPRESECGRAEKRLWALTVS
eukprot:scaffold11462_cov49-Attheya_sp.AAC.2